MASRRTGIWLLTTFLLFLLAFVLFVWFLNRVVIGAAPSLGARTVLHVDLEGPIGEVRGAAGPFASPLTVREIDEALRRAAADERVVAVFLDVGPLASGLGKAQEVRDAVHAFRGANKPAVALIELASTVELYLAATADTLVQVPSGQIILGLLVEEAFYKELLDKIGVRFDAFHTGGYKTAFHAFTRTSLSDEQRRMEESLLESVYRQWIDDVAADRDLDPVRLEEAFDAGLLSASDAMDRGLVDELGYRDTVTARLEEIAGGEVSFLGVRDYLGASGGGFGDLLRIDPVVALVHVGGLMLPGELEGGLFGAEVAAGDTIAGYLRQAGEDAAVRAIVVRIDSPGGAASAADVMAREARRAAERKPVVISMSDVAASGGYWLASAGQRIFADRGTYTGSIGVITGRIDLVGAYEKLGIGIEVLKRGDNADLFSDAVHLRPEQAALLEDHAERMYEDFLRTVAEGRGLAIEEVEAVAAGRVWTGEQALDHGLVDEIGGLHQALMHARREAGLEGRRTSLRIYPPRRTFLQELARLLTMTRVEGGYPSTPAEWLESLRRLAGSGPSWALAAVPAPVPSH